MLSQNLRSGIDTMGWVSPSDLLFVFAIVAFCSLFSFPKDKEKYPSYTAKLSRSTLSNLLLFALGLAIVDLPGLGNFIVWEYLVHHTASIAPYMVIKGFSIISLNTLLVFLFYFSNFLGFPEHRAQMLHHYKRDTLHLRWVQKHEAGEPRDSERQ